MSRFPSALRALLPPRAPAARDVRSAVVIGAGFSGLSAAAHLARAGVEVTVVEKHEQAGGRARTFSQDGFRFDMGPSWYWMPDVFERHFRAFGREVSELYELERLDPSYRVVWPSGDHWDVPAGLAALRELFEREERGAGEAFDRYLEQTRYIYETAMADYLHRPSLSVFEFFDARLGVELYRLKMLRSMEAFAASFFDRPRLQRLVSWPVLFLGASAKDTSAMYSLMSYADMALGTWYPKGGMHRIIEALVEVAEAEGATLELGEAVTRIRVAGGRAVGVETARGYRSADLVLAAADYHHVESQLLAPEHRQLDESAWAEHTMSPSSLVLYLGLRGELPADLPHHALFFDEDLDEHMDAVYAAPRWPERPLFYVCAPSVTDPTVAPAGHSNLFVLVPLAAGLPDDDASRRRCRDEVLRRLSRHVGFDVEERLVLERSYAMRDFEADYGAYRGNAYGMANTLIQTGPFKPPLRSRTVEGLYFAGQLTVPGPGMPPSLISGELAAKVALRDHRVVRAAREATTRARA